jgi:uncharacterized membrane protein YebE (DUF533 family)
MAVIDWKLFLENSKLKATGKFNKLESVESKGYMHCFCYKKYTKDKFNTEARQAAVDFKFKIASESKRLPGEETF